MGRGAVEFVAVEFPGTSLGTGFPPALRAQVERGVIRIVDLLIVVKDPDGSVRSMELSELDDDAEYRAFDEVVHAIDGLISPEDVADVAAALRPGTTALLVLFEHSWMRELRDAVAQRGGRIVFSERIPAEVVDAVVEAATAAA
ncbi:MAG TPA: DUF6325 family protein [Micromonosporaceae bacterium]|jgi:hypothetical protein|nr:DUF6325 family protein [Micromonosporaceae bacterium]